MGAGASGMGRSEGAALQDVEGAKAMDTNAPVNARANPAQRARMPSAVSEVLKSSGVPAEQLVPAGPREGR